MTAQDTRSWEEIIGSIKGRPAPVGGYPFPGKGWENQHVYNPDANIYSPPLIDGDPTIAGGTQRIPVIPYGSTEAQLDPKGKANTFLGSFVDKLKEIWNRPIMAPNITKDEHEQMIQGQGGGVHNWDSRF